MSSISVLLGDIEGSWSSLQSQLADARVRHQGGGLQRGVPLTHALPPSTAAAGHVPLLTCVARHLPARPPPLQVTNRALHAANQELRMKLEGQTQRLELEMQQRLMEQQQQQQQQAPGGPLAPVDTPAAQPLPAASIAQTPAATVQLAVANGAAAPAPPAEPARSNSSGWLGGMFGRNKGKNRAAVKSALV